MKINPITQTQPVQRIEQQEPTKTYTYKPLSAKALNRLAADLLALDSDLTYDLKGQINRPQWPKLDITL